MIRPLEVGFDEESAEVELELEDEDKLFVLNRCKAPFDPSCKLYVRIIYGPLTRETCMNNLKVERATDATQSDFGPEYSGVRIPR